MEVSTAHLKVCKDHGDNWVILRKGIPEVLVTLEENKGKSAKGLVIHQIYFVHTSSRLYKYWAVHHDLQSNSCDMKERNRGLWTP